MKRPNERDYYFDNAKIILILLVVVGHTIEPLIGVSPTLKAFYLFLYFFHMPLFIFISGYFSKNINTRDYAKKVISKLLIPYLIFESAYSVFDYFIFNREKLFFTFFTPYWIMWFMFSMIIWKVILPYVVKIKFSLPISIIAAILIGYAIDTGYYASVSRAFVFFPFFLAGYYFDKKYLNKLFLVPVRAAAIIIMTASLALIYYYGQVIRVEWLYGSFPYHTLDHNEWYAGIYRAAIYAVTLILSICVLSLTPRRTIPLISKMGERTIYVYLLHGFIIKYMDYKGFYSGINTMGEKISLIVVGVLITLILLLPAVRLTTKHAVVPKVERFFH